jgi:hypothetical protein
MTNLYILAYRNPFVRAAIDAALATGRPVSD